LFFGINAKKATGFAIKFLSIIVRLKRLFMSWAEKQLKLGEAKIEPEKRRD
jgi:hypothetical protein